MNNTAMKWIWLIRVNLFLSAVFLWGQSGAEAAVSYDVRFRQENNSLIFSWAPCSTPGFIQLRPRLEGQPDNTQIKTTLCKYEFPNVSIGQTYIVGFQHCSDPNWLGASSCSKWGEFRWTVAEPPSELQLVDESYWTAYNNYIPRYKLRWRPGKALAQVRARGRKIEPMRHDWDWEANLPGTATEAQIPVQLYERWQFVVNGLNAQEGFVGQVYKNVNIAPPKPKPPRPPLVSLLSQDRVHLVWRSDNITEWFEIERLQWPSTTYKMDSQTSKTLAGDRAATPQSPGGAQALAPSGVAKGARLAGGGVTALPPHSPTLPAVTGKQASPTGKGLTPGDPSAPKPLWVIVQRKIPSYHGSIDLTSVDEISKIPVALGGSIYEPYTYRVCAINDAGRTCSDFAQVTAPVLKRDLSTNRVR